MKTRKLFTSTTLAAAVLALACSAPQMQAQNMIIYSNALVNGWANWGWATLNYANTSTVYPGCTDSISVTMASGYQGIQIVHSSMSDSPYASLSFWLNGGASGGQSLQVYGLQQVGTTQNQGAGVNYPLSAPIANTWVQYTVPLSGLGVSNVENFTGFVIQESAGKTEPVFYLDNILLSTNGVGGGSSSPGTNATNYVGIDAGTNRHAISPLIYGVAGGSASQMQQMGNTANRLGGNEETTYNWATNVHGKGGDWYFESRPDDSATPGASADSVVSASKAAGAQALITIPMIGWTPKVGPGRSILESYSVAKYGPQTQTDPYLADAGNGISTTNDTAITWNNPYDAYVPCDTNFQMTYVQHLISTWGVSTNGGVGYYCMDNEHTIWYQTHQDIHPMGPTMQEILGKIEAYSSIVKSLDPNALVLGPEEWGWEGYLHSGYDMQHGGNADSVSNGGWVYCPWLLNQLHQYQTTNGQRLLDYFSLHCYPQEGNVGSSDTDTATELLRNQTTRQFWDPNYVDPSWINAVIDLIPMMSNWVASYYPGTKLAVTEYNWGGETSMNGATAEADILGIFGRQGLDLATRWTVPASPTSLAMQIYRNYDGNTSAFGDTSVLANVTNPDNLSAFAAERSKDGALTIMVVNKYLTQVTPVVINLTNYTGSGSAQVWQLNSNEVINLLSVALPYSGGLIQTTVPSQSITLFIIPPSPNLNLVAGAARTDGNFAFMAQGEIGGTFVLQSSPDLINWTPVSTNTFGSPQVQFVLPMNGAQLFYRVVSTQL